MKAVTAYQSSDGKIFETMDECVLHEDTLKKERAILFLIENNIKFYDEYCEELKSDDFQDLYEQAYYIRFIDVNAEELLNLKKYFCDYYGFEIYFGSSDLLYYYDGEGCFVSLEEKIEDIKEELSRYEQIKHDLED